MNQAEADAELKKCLGIENNAAAFSCMQERMKEIIKETGLCQPKLVLLTADGCEPCAEERAARSTEINDGSMQVVDIFSPEGQEIARVNEIDFTPVVLFLDCHNKAIEP
ncbi:MAG: hypothetical protein Q7R34_01470 [Dehalococcoidia bacterium]|nr:hypothetical protein [Dehalococcoidia bacterium]